MKSLAEAAVLSEIRQRIGRLTPDSTRRWGRMSVGQAVCHLADGCRMALGEVPAGTPPRGGAVRKLLALHLPVRWPRGIPTTREIDQVDGNGTRPATFDADVASLMALIDRCVTSTDLDGRMHPVFGRMTRAEWLRWGYLHLDHHLRQFGA